VHSLPPNTLVLFVDGSYTPKEELPAHVWCPEPTNPIGGGAVLALVTPLTPRNVIASFDRAIRVTSSYHAEVATVLLATCWLAGARLPPGVMQNNALDLPALPCRLQDFAQVVLLPDNKSCVDIIENKCTFHEHRLLWLPILRLLRHLRKRRAVRAFHIYSHCGIEDNERVDQRAKAAALRGLASRHPSPQL